MNRSNLFSSGLLAIEMELDDLIDRVGGTDGIKLLDAISSLGQGEKQEMIQVFLSILQERKLIHKKGSFKVISGGAA